MISKEEIESVYGPIIGAALRQNEKIYEGKSHSECFTQEPKGVLVSAEQGFITENRKFVDRYVALAIAKHYNQIKHKHDPKDILFSEDLY